MMLFHVDPPSLATSPQPVPCRAQPGAPSPPAANEAPLCSEGRMRGQEAVPTPDGARQSCDGKRERRRCFCFKSESQAGAVQLGRTQQTQVLPLDAAPPAQPRLYLPAAHPVRNAPTSVGFPVQGPLQGCEYGLITIYNCSPSAPNNSIPQQNQANIKNLSLRQCVVLDEPCLFHRSLVSQPKEGELGQHPRFPAVFGSPPLSHYCCVDR